MKKARKIEREAINNEKLKLEEEQIYIIDEFQANENQKDFIRDFFHKKVI